MKEYYICVPYIVVVALRALDTFSLIMFGEAVVIQD